MSVTILDVRGALNSITEDELTDLKIQQSIDDSQIILASKIVSPISTDLFDIAVRDYAAYKAFSVSNVFKSAKFGPLSVQRDIQGVVDILKAQSEEAIINASPSNLKLKVGYMFSDRAVEIPTKAVL